MHDVSTLLLYLVPLLLFFGIYLRRHARTQARDTRRLHESIESGLTEPVSLHPVIDPMRCVGSSSCVRACPEGALGMIDGKAQLVDPSICIGHGACAASCPLEAITLVFGTARRGIDIPYVKPTFETNVAGIFIAGELGGMGLIRKAVEQGRQAMNSIRDMAGARTELDVVIVGAGPAGIAAGLAAMHHRLKHVVIEQEDSLGGTVYHYPRNKIAMTAPMQLPIVGKVKVGDISKEALLDLWQQVVGRSGLKISFSERMDAIERTDRGFVVKSTRNSYIAKAVLLAIGRRGTPRKLGVPGEERPKVVYRLVDAEQYRGQRILIVGGGDSAVEAAVALAEQPGTQVVLSYRGEALNRIKPKNRQRLDDAAGRRTLQILLQSTVQRIDAADVEIRHGGRSLKLPNDTVIVCAGGVLPMDLLRTMGIEFETKFGTA